RITQIEFDRQIDLRNGIYCPLTRVKELHCWPSEPCWEQLDPGQVDSFEEHIAAGGHVSDLESGATPWQGRREILEVAEDDRVILGLPIGVLPHTCRDLLA